MAPTANKKTDFARSQLLKFGWTEGKGLGKDEDGISVPVKPVMKSDRSGVGHDPGEEYKFEWWNHVYNAAANSIQVDNNEDNVKLRKINDVEISTKKPTTTGDTNDKEYEFFVKASVGGTEPPERKELTTTLTLSADDLFRKCGNLTGHKAARHGNRLSGKLRRLDEQEKKITADKKFAAKNSRRTKRLTHD